MAAIGEWNRRAAQPADVGATGLPELPEPIMGLWSENIRKAWADAMQQYARDAVAAAQGVIWSADPPAEQGWYWHWSGNPDDAPFPLSVLWSGTSKTCFIARGQVGEDAVFCEKYGGYWTPVVEPRIPETLPKKGKSK